MGSCLSSSPGHGPPPPPVPSSPPLDGIERQDSDAAQSEESNQLSIRSTPRVGGTVSRPIHLRERLIHESHEDPLSLFDIVKQLGVGLSGSVHLVKSKKTGTHFALKLLEKSAIEEDNFEQFLLEVSLLRELDHPHIVRLVETFDVEDGKALALLMEYLSGGELYSVLNEQPNQKFPEADAAVIMRQTVSAVAFLHSQGIVHRDLKLENFLFTKPGGKVVKLIDLGLSRRYCSVAPTEGSAIRRMHSVVGTPYYIAPEILQLAEFSEGRKDGYDSSVDSWSLGVIAYMLLSGAPPFKGLRDNEVLLNVRRGKYTLADARWEGVSDLAKDFVRKLLVYDPAKRMSAGDALRHPWLLPAKAATDTAPLPEELVPGLRRFSTLQGWQRAVLEAVAFSCPDEEVEHLRGAFQRLDKHDIGYLSQDDFIAALGTLGVGSEEAEELFVASALGNTEGIHWNSFIAAVLPRNLLSRARLQEAFDALDVERVGFLTRDSFAAVLADDIEDVEFESLFQKTGDKCTFEAFLEAFESNSPFMRGRVSSVLVESGGVGGGGGGAAASKDKRPQSSSLDLRGGVGVGAGGGGFTLGEVRARGSTLGLLGSGEARARGSSLGPLLILETSGFPSSGLGSVGSGGAPSAVGSVKSPLSGGGGAAAGGGGGAGAPDKQPGFSLARDSSISAPSPLRVRAPSQQQQQQQKPALPSAVSTSQVLLTGAAATTAPTNTTAPQVEEEGAPSF